MINVILIPIAIFCGLGALAGISLTIFSRIFAVETDERASKIREALPGLNCGVCGFSGCDSYAVTLVLGDAPTNKCIPGGDETSQKISEIMGLKFVDVIETIAFVKCDGAVPDATADLFYYRGEPSCVACNMFYQGKGVCGASCIGFGDCARACVYGAIRVVNEVAVIDKSLCKGCAMCVRTCPKKLIEIRDDTKKVFVKCSSHAAAKETIASCTRGCIGCGKCVKVCKSDAITVVDGLAVIDYKKCVSCLECAKNCPRKCIATE